MLSISRDSWVPDAEANWAVLALSTTVYVGENVPSDSGLCGISTLGESFGAEQ